MRGLTIAQSRLADADWEVIAVTGEVDLATAPELERAVKAVLEGGPANLVIDLSDTTFMDSTGLRVLITADLEFKGADRRLAILVKPGPIRRERHERCPLCDRGHRRIAAALATDH